MKTKTLVEILERDVIEGNLALYRNLLDTTNEATDPVWKAILPLYINFSKDEKEAFLNFLKVVEINSVSHVLGLLDGTIYADGIEEEFILTTEVDNEKINENLQDLFIELVEEK